MTYTPDRWIIVKIATPEETLYKVLGGWSGSWANPDSWRLSSGITSAKEFESYYEFYGYSGSTYKCHKNAYGLTTLSATILQQFKDKAGDMVHEVAEDNLKDVISLLEKVQ